jgi:hypothetical protein
MMRIGMGLMALVGLGVAVPAQGQMSLPGKFEVTDTGSASYTIPIGIVPGTAGLEPKLSLQYDSRSGNGLLGVGWSLAGLPAITRCGRTIAQDGQAGGVSYDANDRFCLDGQRLIAISGTYGADGIEYRTERESFSRVVSYGTAGSGPSYFKVWTKAGLVMEFGNTADSKIEAQGKASVRVWALNKTSDTKSNYFTVSYTKDNANGEYRPDRVDYTGNATAGASPQNSVRFVYETRPDIVPLYQAGSLIKTSKRMKAIALFSGESLVASYKLSYGVIDSNNGAVLSRVSSLVKCTAAEECVRPTDFTYLLPAKGWTEVAGYGPPYPLWTRGLDDEGTALLDVNGDGLVDVVRHLWAGGTFYPAAWLNDGPGWTAAPQFYAPPYPIWSRGYDNEGIAFADVNGDGLVDIVRHLSAGGNSYQTAWLNTGAGWVGAQQYAPPYPILTRGLGSEGVAFVDVNGDGLTDIVRYLWSEGVHHKTAWLNTGSGWIEAPQYAPPSPLWSRGLDDEGMAFVDVNGDGLVDIVRHLSAGGVSYKTAWLNTGAGWVGAQEYAPPYPILTRGLGSEGVAFVDVNGDGLPDIVRYLWSEGVHYKTAWLNTGSGWVEATQYAPPYPIWSRGLDNEGIEFADINGDGQVDIVRHLSAGGYSYKQAWIKQQFPFLLGTISNGLVVTTIQYKPASDASVHVAAAAGVGWPETTNIKALGYVVSEVRSSNGLGIAGGGGEYRSTYRYAGAKADLHGRGFLGFRQMTVRDEQTGVEQTTTYRQDYPFTGLVASREKKLGTQLLNRSTNSYASSNLGGTRRYPYLTQSLEESWELTGAALPAVTAVYQYDAYGNATQVGVSTGDGHSKTTVNTYSNDAASWLLGRLTRSEVTSTTPGN